MALAISLQAADSISSYNALRTEVAAWLNRDDLTDRIPGFIRLFESRLNRILRTPEMESSVLLSVSSEDTQLPTDFMAMRELYIEGVPRRPLRNMSPDGLAAEFSGVSGIPVAYAITGRTIKLAPPPASTISLRLVYFARIVSLNDSNPNNWLLLQAPDLYLYGTLLQAAAFIDDPERVAQWKAAHDEALAEVLQAGNLSRWGAAPIVPNTVSQVRHATC